jgi:hypothetical protein
MEGMKKYYTRFHLSPFSLALRFSAEKSALHEYQGAKP